MMEYYWIIFCLLLKLFPKISCLDVTTTSSEEGVEGQTGVIRCFYSNKNPQDEIFVVLWQKYDDVTGKHVTIFNSQKYKLYPEKFVDSRYKPQGHASLQIHPLMRSDTGKYRCQVTPLPSFQQGEAETKLTVNYSPELTTQLNSTFYLNEGDDVTLPCEARGVPTNLNYTWYHQQINGDFQEEKIDVNLDKRGRYAKDNNLRLFNFTPAYEGKYKCEVSNKIGSVSSHFLVLLNRPIVITTTSGTSMTIVEGDDVTMHVMGRGIPNNVTYYWLYEDQPLGVFGWSGIFGHQHKQIVPYLRITTTTLNGSKLEMIEATRGVSGNYSCVAWNGVGAPAIVNLTLDVTYEANITTSPNTSYVIVENNVLQIPCSGTGNPQPWIQWTLPSGLIMTSQDNATGYDVGLNGTLTIKSASKEDSGLLECLVFNGVKIPSKVETEVIVLYAPTFIEMPSSYYYVMEGDDVTFPCIATSLPEAEYSWYKDFGEIDSIYNDITMPSSYLHIRNVTSQHRGKYRCQARNYLGLVFAETTLEVLFPTLIEFMTSDFETTVSSDVNITCLSRGFPLPTIQWLHSSFTPSIGIASVIRNGTRGRTFIVDEQLNDVTIKSTLMLTRFGLRDFATYYCTAVNKFASRTRAVDVKSIDFPTLPENVTINHMTKTSYMVTWSTSQNIPDTKYYAHIRSMSEPFVNVTRCRLTSCLMTSLNESTTYGVTVYGVNFAGKGERSMEIFATTIGSAKTTTALTTTTLKTTTTTTNELISSTIDIVTSTSKQPPTYSTKIQSSSTLFKTFLPTTQSTPTTTMTSHLGVYDVTYNVSEDCVRWKIDDVMELLLTSSWNSSGIPKCVKIEAKKQENLNWTVVANCAPVWTESYHFTRPRDQIWAVRLIVCWGVNKGCGEPNNADVINVKERPILKPVDHINTITLESDKSWLSAVIGASVAVVLVVSFYFVSFAFAYNRRKQMALLNHNTLPALESGIKRRRTKLLFGYDNFALDLEGEDLPEIVMTSQNGIRECSIKKEPEEEFEFFLKVDDVRKGQLITSITKDGPADRAGAKDGDRVIEVNGVNVEKRDHSEVVDMIRDSIPKNLVVFKVVDEAHDPNMPKPKPVEAQVAVRKTNGNADVISDLRPRICKIPKLRNTFGFSLQATTNARSGHFVKGLIEGGPAVESGLRENDRIIEVGGVNVEKLSHEKVVGLVKKSGNKVTLLVVDEDTYRHFMAKKIKIKAKRAVSTSEHVISNSRNQSTSSTTPLTSSDVKARLVHVTKANNQGYGFFLRVKKDEEGEFIGAVAKGMAASECGLMDEDRVVAINGTIVFNKEHNDVTNLVKEVPQHVVFLVFGPEAQKNASQNGLLSTLKGATLMLPEKPRVVQVSKGDDGYGFYLKMEMNNPMHIIGDVEDGSEAQKAGLKNGEVVACVGDYDVMNKSHDDTVGKIKDAGNDVTLTVASRKTMDLLHKLKISVTQEFLNNWPGETGTGIPDFTDFDRFFAAKVVAKVAEVSHAIERQPTYAKINKTRTCKLIKEGGGFGFFLRDENGHILGNVEQGGAAEKAGVLENDRIIEVDGENVENESHDQVVDRIRNAGDKVTFLVKSSVKREAVQTVEATSTSEVVTESAVPLPRLCVVTKGDGGFGFHLNGETEGRPGQYIRRVVGDGPADAAGLKNGDRVIEVNEESISGKTHEEVVQIIIKSGSKITFLVVDEEADIYYSKKSIAVTAALLIAKAVKQDDDAAMTRSSSTSTITEASVHVDPEEEPEIDFPPPPDAQSLHESLHSQLEVLDQLDESIKDDDAVDGLDDVIRDEEAQDEFRQEIVDEVKEEIAEAIVENIADDVREEITDDVREEVADEVRDEIIEAIQDQIADDVKEEIADDVREEFVEAVMDEIVDDVREEIAEAIVENVREEIIDDVREEIIDDVREEIIDDVREEIIDDIREEIADDVRTAVKVAVAAEIVQEVREEIEERQKEEAREEFVQDVIDDVVDDVIEERIEDKVEERIASRNSSVTDNAPTSPVIRGKPTRQSNPTAIVPMGKEKENLEKVVGALKAVQRAPQVSSATSNNDAPSAPPSFRNARAMFEKSNSNQTRPSWVKPAPVVKKTVVNGDIKKQAAQPSAKPLAKKVSANGMMFNIVETSSVFN